MYGLCLLEWFRKEHTWEHLFRLLGQLGQDSRWGKAMYNDPEMAEELAAKALDNPEAKWRPDDRDWTLLNEQLGQLIDLQKKHMLMISSTPTRAVETFPRPVTAFNQALERLQQERDEGNLARIYSLVEHGQQRWLEGHRAVEHDPNVKDA